MKVILISGWANKAAAMEPLASVMAGRDNIECVDLHTLEEIGFRFPAGAGVSAYASGLVYMLERAAEPCVVGGWSMGGLVAQEAYAVVPKRFAGLMFFATTPKFCMGDGYTHGAPAKVVDGMMFMLRKAPEQVLTAFYSECSGFSKEQEKWRELFVRTALGFGQDILRRGLNYLKASDFRSIAAEVKCPAIVFHGSRDLVISVRAGRDLAKECGAEFVTIKGGHHDLVLSATERIGLKAAQFLRERF